MADNNSVALNAVLVSGAVTSLGNALHAGDKAEGAIVDAVRAVTFMAIDRIGSRMLEDGGNYDVEVKPLVNDPFTLIVKRLIMKGRPVYRDSNEVFARTVKGKPANSRERIAAVNDYIAECKGGKKFGGAPAKDYVWTVSQVRVFSKKVVESILYTPEGNRREEGREFARRLAGIEGDAQIQTWTDYFEDTFGKTFAALNAAFKREPAAPSYTNPADAITKAIEGISDLAILKAIEAGLKSRIAAVQETEKKMDAVAGPVDDEVYDDEIEAPAPHVIEAPKKGHAHHAKH